MDGMEVLIVLLAALSTPALAGSREYHFVNLPKNWSEAQSYCRERFADLATIENTHDWTTVREMVSKWGQPSAWLGLYDDVKSWRWSMDNTSLYDRLNGSWFRFNPYAFQENGIQVNCGSIYSGEIYTYMCEFQQNSVCYDESTDSYVAVTDAKSWHSAQSYCRETYTDLASITNQQEYDTALSSVLSSSGHWIGLSREGWKWSDRSEASLREWAAGGSPPQVALCASAKWGGWEQRDCNDRLPFICSVPQMKVFKVTLKTDGSVNPNDPLLLEAIVNEMEEALKAQGLSQFRLRWRKQPHGDVFNDTEVGGA